MEEEGQDSTNMTGPKTIEITKKSFKRMEESILNAPGIGALRRMVQIFKDVITEGDGTNTRMKTYLIYDYTVLNHFIKFMVEKFP